MEGRAGEEDERDGMTRMDDKSSLAFSRMTSPYTPQWFASMEAGAAEQFDKVQWRVSENRSRFFERLALLSAGAVVLSVSLLSTVLGKAVIHGAMFLFVGWGCFIVALLASLFRELKYQPY